MLTLSNPEVLLQIQQFPGGIFPFYDIEKEKHLLVIKCSKETILTAKLNNQFKVYPMFDPDDEACCLGLISTFFDYEDDPLTITTPLFSQDDLLFELAALFNKEEFDAFFFDETNRELLGVSIFNADTIKFVELFSKSKFLERGQQEVPSIWAKMHHRFKVRTSADDDAALTVNLGMRLYPDNLNYLDVTTDFIVEKVADGLISTKLERQEPGRMQEYEIAVLLNRIFEATEIYLNPYRSDTDRELTDVLVVTGDYMIFVQAKDSPNTEASLRRKTSRKRSTILSHVEKATAQMEGAVKYAKNHSGVTIRGANGPIKLELGDRQIIGIVVVKELFEYDYKECSLPILKLIHELEIPIALYDYGDLNTLTHYLMTSDNFVFNGIYKIVDKAIELKQFPKPRFLKKPN